LPHEPLGFALLVQKGPGPTNIKGNGQELILHEQFFWFIICLNWPLKNLENSIMFSSKKNFLKINKAFKYKTNICRFFGRLRFGDRSGRMNPILSFYYFFHDSRIRPFNWLTFSFNTLCLSMPFTRSILTQKLKRILNPNFILTEFLFFLFFKHQKSQISRICYVIIMYIVKHLKPLINWFLWVYLISSIWTTQIW